MKKKLLMLMLCLSVCFSLAACADDKEAEKETDSDWIEKNQSQLGDSITSGKIYLDGNVYTFPMDLQELLDKGWHISNNYDNIDTFKLEPGYSSTEFELFNEDSDYVKVSVINMSDEDATVDKCMVEYLRVTASEFDFLLPCGITKRNTQAEIEEAYGDDISVKKTDDDGSVTYASEFISKDVNCTVEMFVEEGNSTSPLFSVTYALKSTSGDMEADEVVSVYIDSALKASFYNDYVEYVANLYDSAEGANELYESEVAYYASFIMYWSDIYEEYMTEEIINEFKEIAKVVLSKVKWEIVNIDVRSIAYDYEGNVKLALYPTDYVDLINAPIEETIDKFNEKYGDVDLDTLDEAERTEIELEYANMVLEAIDGLENEASTGHAVNKTYEIDSTDILNQEQWDEIDDIIMGIPLE